MCLVFTTNNLYEATVAGLAPLQLVLVGTTVEVSAFLEYDNTTIRQYGRWPADLRDVRGNAGDGIHGASAGGLWQAAVFGFAGLQFAESGPSLQPNLPAGWKRLAFHFVYQNVRYQAVATPTGGEVQALP